MRKVVVAMAGSTARRSSGVRIYIDNSNVWIEGKKLASRLSQFITYEDPRVRIDIGKLASAIAAKRPIVEANVYGSEPPKTDRLWEIAKSMGFKVFIHKRSPKTGKEKMVDTRMSVHIATTAAKNEPEKDSAFIVVSGDADHIPAIEEAVQGGWKVEVHMWHHAISSQLLKFEGVTVHKLDDHRESITFVTWRTTFKEASRYGWCAVSCESRSSEIRCTSGWRKEVEKISKWPVQYWIKGSHEIILVFRKWMKSYPSKDRVQFDVHNFITNANGKLPGVKMDEYMIETPSLRPSRAFNRAVAGIQRYTLIHLPYE